MFLDQHYYIISSESERIELMKELRKQSTYFFDAEKKENMSFISSNGDHVSENRRSVLITGLDPNIGLNELVNTFPDFRDRFDAWVIDGWERAKILGVKNQVLEVPNARVILVGTNFFGLEILRAELTFVDLEEQVYPDWVNREIRNVINEWEFEMNRRKAKTLALGLYHVFEK